MHDEAIERILNRDLDESAARAAVVDGEPADELPTDEERLDALQRPSRSDDRAARASARTAGRRGVMGVQRWSLMTPTEHDAYADELNRVEHAEQSLPQFVEDRLVIFRIARIITTPATPVTGD
jgi:hypothetical protein